MSILLSMWTVIVFIVFIGIVIWAWSNKRTAEFEEAANIPFAKNDHPDNEINSKQEESING